MAETEKESQLRENSKLEALLGKVLSPRIEKLSLLLSQSSDAIRDLAELTIGEALKKRVDPKAKLRRLASTQKKALELLEKVNVVYAQGVKDIIGKSYEVSVEQASKILNFKPPKNLFQSKTVTELIRSTIREFASLTDSTMNRFALFITRTKQHILSDFEIAGNLAKGLGTRGTPQALSSELRALFSRFSNGKLIQAGEKTYQLKTYAEMVSRTMTRDANSIATVNTTLRSGNDLVQVSDHNTTTPICEKHEGKIYSISGESVKYPKLKRRPAFHTNCFHVLFPYVEL